MSDAAPIPEDSHGQSEGSLPPGKPRLLADPVVRVMVYASIGLTILFLATVVSVLATGVTAPTGPRSVAERQLIIASAQADRAVGDAVAPYVNALIATNNLPAARVALAQARSSVSATTPASGLDLAEARLLSKEGHYAQVVSLADKVMKRIDAEAESKDVTHDQDYYDAALVKAYAFVELGRWTDAVASFDIYIRENPTASDILVDRGSAKVELKDKAGAEKDFRAALRYVPYDQEAKAGLRRIGVEQ